jgi:uncharacterized membrane protein
MRVDRGLGWFSIGLGVTQLFAPRAVARLVGIEGDAGRTTVLMCLVGVREIVAGIGILARRRPAGWLWARVGGDAMDLTLLGSAFRAGSARYDRLGAACAAVVGITALDLWTAERLRRRGRRTAEDAMFRRPQPSGEQGPHQDHAREDQTMDVKKAITVGRPVEEVYRYWRDFENLPRFMRHLESVQTTGDGRSRWRAKAPAGKTVEWDAEIVDDQPNRRIAWRSLEGAEVDNAGEVRFEPAPAGRGTEVYVALRYDPPAGPVGALVAKLFGEEPGQQVEGDLRRFKQVLETGSVTVSEATVHEKPHPARPPEGPVATATTEDKVDAVGSSRR